MSRLAALAALMLLAPALSTAREPALRPALSPEPSAGKEIAELRAELARIAASGPQGAAVAREKLQALNVRETALAARLGEDRNRLARLLSALQLFRRHPPPALLVSPDDARDAVRAAILIRAMTPELERRAAALSAEAQGMAALRREAAAANAELFTAESAMAEQSADIERLLESQAAPDSLFASSPGAMVTTLPSGASAGVLASLVPPVSGPLIRPYGSTLPAGGRSPGVAFAAPRGATVRAPASGVVEFAAPVTGWGIVVILRTPSAHHLVLGGLAEATVAPGQSVASGAPIGQMSDGGKSPPELYLEVRRNGAPLDPARLLAGASRRTAGG